MIDEGTFGTRRISNSRQASTDLLAAQDKLAAWPKQIPRSASAT